MEPIREARRTFESANPIEAGLCVDCHVHAFLAGERPELGYVNPRTLRSWKTRALQYLFGLHREPGVTLSEKMEHRLLASIEGSRLSHAVVLAQDEFYDASGERRPEKTEFHVSNDYVIDLARNHPKIIPGGSINPYRNDACDELARLHEAGVRLVKIHTAIHGVDPSLTRFRPFYERARALGMTLMFHTGYEHSCRIVSQTFTDPQLLATPLETGVTVIAAHSGTCMLFDREDYLPRFVKMAEAHGNLYGDTSILATMPRFTALARLSRASAAVQAKLLHGSDFPYPSSRLALPLARWWPGRLPTSGNALDRDIEIKQAYNFPAGYSTRILDLLKLSPVVAG